jgi:hypothetical protein
MCSELPCRKGRSTTPCPETALFPARSGRSTHRTFSAQQIAHFETLGCLTFPGLLADCIEEITA